LAGSRLKSMSEFKFERWRLPLEEALQAQNLANLQPSGLYEPIDYFMNLGGKRLRPIVCLAAAEQCGATMNQAMGAALAIEWFHNFSLVHDDIMDKAPLRRGQPTIHERNGLAAGVLCGDRMLVQAYVFLSKSPESALPSLLSRFNQIASDVCEGQQLDMDFEQRKNVAPHEYIEMIRLKTAVLLGFALEAGALCAGWSNQMAAPLYRFGEQLGIAFQIKDDWLDAFGDPNLTGKQPGGDVLARKKTWIWIQAHQQAEHLLSQFDTLSDPERVKRTLDLFADLNLPARSMELALHHKKQALDALATLTQTSSKSQFFQEFADYLLGRDY
jgi:geranylgeranyl diphosphate synthase, type II